MTLHTWLYGSLKSVSNLCLLLLNRSNPLFAQAFVEEGTINSDGWKPLRFVKTGSCITRIKKGYKYYLLTYLGIIALYITAILKN